MNEKALENSGPERRALAFTRLSNTSAALAAAGLFFVVITANLCFPAPQGPADNGDFVRITSEFSTGPKGFESARPEGGRDQGGRYFIYYHRFWVLERPGDTSFHVPCSSSLLFLPGRFLHTSAPPGYFDLTFNTFVLIVALAVAVFLFLRLLPPIASLPIGLVATVVFADAGVASYLNSFYQESGAYFFTILFLCALGWWWLRGSWPSMLAFLGAAVFAMASKRPLTISVAIIVLVVTGAPVVLARFERRSLVRFLLALVAVAVTGVTVNRVASLPLHSKVYCYSSIFDGMLPMLAEGERVEFLQAVGLPGSFAGFSGVLPHGAGTPLADVKVQAAMSGAVQERAVVIFMTHYPAGLIRLLRRVMHVTGRYEVPGFGYRGQAYSPALQHIGSLHLWTIARRYVLGGWIGYAAGALLAAVLFVLKPSSGSRQWFSSLRYGSLAFYLASLSQIVVVALGDGCISVPKALYFANLTLDIELLLASAAIGVVVLTRRKALDDGARAWAARTPHSGA